MLARVPSRFLHRPSTALAVCVTMLAASSCQKVPLLAPTASVITVITSRSVLPINGTAQIIATVIEQSGTPAHDGTLVTFTTTLGTLDPQEAVTSNGQAVVTLRAGTQSGTAEVSAFSGGARPETPLTITIGAAAAAGVTVTASPATVPSAGGTVTIAASVSDATGNRLAGVPVSFSTTAGTLAASQVITDASGAATTTLTTSLAATVDATVIPATSGSTGVTGRVAVTVDDAPTIVLLSSPAAPETNTVTNFTVTVTKGTNPIRSASIDFGDGQSQGLGALVGGTSVTHTYTVPGQYNVTATVSDTTGEVVSVLTRINVSLQLPLAVTVTSSASPTVNSPVAFTASAGLGILRYDWDFGDGFTTSTTGAAAAHVYSSPGLRTVTVTATHTDGRTGTGQTQVNVVPTEAPAASFTVSPKAGTTATSFIFNASASTSSTGTTIVRYEWNFGDGTTRSCPADSLCRNGNRTISHEFGVAGTYRVILTITDSNGATATSATEDVEVS